MSTAQVANVTDEVAVTGFIRRDLKIWFTDDYIKRTLLKECLDIRTSLFERCFAIHFTNGRDKSERGYFIPEYGIAFGEADEYDVNDRTWLDKPMHIFSEVEARKIFVDNWETFQNIAGLSREKDSKGILSLGGGSFYIKCQNGRFNIRNGKYEINPKDAKVIPCCVLSRDDFHVGFATGKYTLIEDIDSKAAFHNSVLSIILEYKKYIDIQDFDTEHITQMLEKCQERTAALRELQPERFSEIEIERAFSDWLASAPTLTEVQTQIVLHAVLMADTYRCELTPKPATCLEESGEGHWELFNTTNDGTVVRLCRKYAARDPHIDFCRDGIVGIDFGTKSTVVSLRDEGNTAKLIRVGTSSYSTTTKVEDYENPTILEFVDIPTFLEAYRTKVVEGRPYTSIQDIKSSHYSRDDLEKAKSDDLSTFLTDIKQWCGDTTGSRVPIIRDKTGKEPISLPAFKDCSPESVIDPLEIYAYYLGLSINNMFNKIFLKYDMSFPTTYEKEIRDRMAQSFKRGIKRALPDAIVKDDELMEGFEVKAKWSEPAAYAVCAMKEYQFKPKQGEKVFYSVFDFGGGTTDMIFGIWRAADQSKRAEKRYTWIIEQFKDEGDKYLGGENLLELMAYEVFISNTAFLEQDRTFPFTKPANGREVSGLERLINKSPAARRNTMQLAMKLRPLWEGIEGYSGADTPDSTYDGILDADDHANRILRGYTLRHDTKIDFIKTGYIEIELEDDNGETAKINLYIDNPENGIFVDLIGILEKRIEEGINTYFNALSIALKDERANGTDTVHLLLAGNSSKSPILDKLLRKHIAEFKASYQSPLEIQILPPLGTEQSYKAGAKRYEDRPDRPTGKTGVAYGLVDTSVRVYEETGAEDEAKFKFYIGLNHDDTFVVKVDRSVEYKKWQPMEVPADGDLELYYTSLADAQSGTLDISRTKRKNCPIKKPDEDKDFYVRTLTPDTIEYGVGEICEDGKFDESSIVPIGTIQLTP